MSDETKSMAELTIKAVLLGVVLSVVLAGANAYLGLFAGMTVSASIPAAVVSMGVLRLFRRSNILENNLVQTAASAGESLAAGVIFTLPALIILDYWTDFNYWWVTIIAAFGGILGVLFTIPLRRALIVEGKLKFPEGIATAEVLHQYVPDAHRELVSTTVTALLEVARAVADEVGQQEARLLGRLGQLDDDGTHGTVLVSAQSQVQVDDPGVALDGPGSSVVCGYQQVGDGDRGPRELQAAPGRQDDGAVAPQLAEARQRGGQLFVGSHDAFLAGSGTPCSSSARRTSIS